MKKIFRRNKKDFPLIGRIEELEKKNNELELQINNLINQSYNQDKHFMKVYKSLEYKVHQINSELNILLYENYLTKLTKKENFNPKISIIIPVYNGKNYLKEAIDCALNQTYKNVEIIVVNDGSNDNGSTRDIAKKYGKKIKYFEKNNGGVSTALNYGIRKMTGDYFAWLSHDDLIDTIHIEKLVEFISYEENIKKIPYASFKIIDEKGNYCLDQTIIAQLWCNDFKTSMVHNYYTLLEGEINGGSVLIPKEAFEKHGYFNEKLRIAQERDMWGRLIREYKFINIPYDTASTRIHNDQVTNVSKKTKEESDDKKFEIINNLTKEEILNLELSINEFYEKIIYFFDLNGNGDLVNRLSELAKKRYKNYKGDDSNV